MTQHAEKPRPDSVEPSERSRKQSGTRRIPLEDVEPALSGVESTPTPVAHAWPAVVDQDSIPTQPANEQPSAQSIPDQSQERPAVTVEMPPSSYEEVRDTIPAPPPDASE